MLEKENDMIFWNFIKAWVRFHWARARGYIVIASGPAIARRSGICEGCDFYKEGVCARCGCLTVSKVVLNTEKCPVGKWPAIWIKKYDRQT